jgi:hypothetical protein
MSAFPYILSIPDAEVYNLYTDRRFTLGQLAQTLDGRKFRFVYNAAVLLVPGDVLQASAPITNHILQTATTAGKVGDTTVVMTLGATAMWQNQYQDGVLSIELGTGFGFAYPLGAHVNFLSSSTTAAVPFKRGVTLQVAVPTTANSISFISSPYNQVIQSPTTLTAQPVGVAVSAIPASGTAPATPQFGWIQVGGLASVTTIGTVVIGSNVMVPTTTAGGCAPNAADTTPVIGTVAHVATTTNKSTIMLGGVLS